MVWVAFNDLRFYHSFQIQLVPVFRGLLQHCIQIHRIGDQLTRGFGPLPEDSRQDNDELSGDIVVNSGDNSVVMLTI